MNLRFAWITGLVCVALYVYWVTFNHASFNGWYLLAMAILALLSGWFLDGHRRGRK